MTTETQIKSRDRVRDLAEVYTAEREVNAMLDLLGDVNWNLNTTYLEPACGNGNFLVAILARKLNIVRETKRPIKQIEAEFMILKAVASIHGVDIDQENVEQARARMRVDVVDFLSETFNTWKVQSPFWTALDIILETNIQQGDMLNGTDKIFITEWKTPRKLSFSRRVFAMDDMLRTGGGTKGPLKPVSQLPTQHFRKLTHDN